jgi:hypothetical protein
LVRSQLESERVLVARLEAEKREAESEATFLRDYAERVAATSAHVSGLMRRLQETEGGSRAN